MQQKQFVIAIHGGAGTIRQSEMTAEKQVALELVLKESIDQGFRILASGGSAIEAVKAAVVVMEDSPLLNAGRGAVFTADETIEMDTAIMCGRTQTAGAAACVKNIRNPIKLADEIRTKTRHVLLNGNSAEQFARSCGLEFEADEYFFTQHRFDQLKKARRADTIQLDHGGSADGKCGTVGAVALDQHGDLAAATSTGGVTNQMAGRVGDSPLIGAGTYANNETCAVSCTGTGESFVRAVSAYDVSALMMYRHLSVEEAGRVVVFEQLPRFNGAGGLIAIDHRGVITMPFNTEGMYRALRSRDSGTVVGMYKD